MANPTTNYSWQMPTATDLVTDLPADFAVFGQANDTTIKNLNPQTTTGALAYRSATSNVNTALPIGTTNQVLTVVAGVPAWAASGGGATWAAWTPTFTNLTVGNGTLTARYATVGQLTTFSFKFVLGSTSSIGAGVQCSWPVTPASATAAQTAQFSVWIQDISSGAFFSTVAAYQRTTSVWFFTNLYVSGTAIGADTSFTSTSPFTWASGDLIWASATYETA